MLTVWKWSGGAAAVGMILLGARLVSREHRVPLHPALTAPPAAKQEPPPPMRPAKRASEIPPKKEAPPTAKKPAVVSLSGRPKRFLTLKNPGAFGALAFSPDGRTLVCASDPPNGPGWPPKYQSDPASGRVVTPLLPLRGSLNFWDTRTGRLVRRIPFHTQVTALAISPNGRLLLGDCNDYTRRNPKYSYWTEEALRIWDLRTGKVVRSILKHDGGVPVFSRDGRRVVVRTEGGVQVFSAATWRRQRTLRCPPNWDEVEDNSEIALSPDGKLVAARVHFGDAGTGELAVWNVRSGKRLCLLGHGDEGAPLNKDSPLPDSYQIQAPVTFVPGGRTLLCGKSFLDLRSPHQGLKPLLKEDIGWPLAVYAARHRILMVSYADDQPALWDISRKKRLATVNGGFQTQTQFSPNGKLLAIPGDNEIQVWSVK